MESPNYRKFNNAKELHSFLKDTLSSKINANIYTFWKKDKRDGVSKAAFKAMLKDVTKKWSSK